MKFYKNGIMIYCQMVKTGKPVASMALQERYVESAIALITKEYELKACVESLAEGWVTLYIYKYSHIPEVIKSIPQAPKTVFDHWLLGKLFGYEEVAIQEFLVTKKLL
ncbi:MAG: hypothetical protein MJA84_07275 [Firmicutes bacterium]|nr:hypothetical protein [Bacillota bacterium]